jgi:ornithine decarboxylase
MSIERIREVSRLHANEGSLLILDLESVRRQIRRFKECLPNVRLHYAMKANPHPMVLQCVAQEDGAFDIASAGELRSLRALGVDGTRMIFSNPIKSPSAILEAWAGGVRWFVVDSAEEMTKCHALVPQASQYMRIDVPNEGSAYPLTGKFGATLEEAQALIELAAEHQVRLRGISFHVGSQCYKPDNWVQGIALAGMLFEKMRKKGLSAEVLNIGGGFPVQMAQACPSLEEIAQAIRPALSALPAPIAVWAEPGRFVVGEAGWLVCRIIGTAQRGEHAWMYWDTGLIGGLMETYAGLRYPMWTDKTGPLTHWVVAGPTCDAQDVTLQNALLPQDMAVGDCIYLGSAGAYTQTYATEFNGFPLPSVIFV